jgi:hypothetical protein
MVVVGITNPSASSCSVSASSYMASGNQLEYSASATISYVATRIVQASLAISDPTVAAIATYAFTLNNTNSLAAAAELGITFPQGFTLTGLTCTLDGAATAFTIDNATSLRIVIASAMGPHALMGHTFEVVGVINPSSLKPTPSFSLSLVSAGVELESLSDGVYARLTTPALFSSLSLTPSSLTTGSKTSYVFSFNHSLSIGSTNVAKLTVSLPSDYYLLSCSACFDYSTFTISSNITSVTISDVLNPSAVLVASAIVVQVVIDDYLAIYDTLASPTFTAASLAYTVSSNSSFMGEAVSLNLSLAGLPLTAGFLLIAVPTEYSVGTLSVYSPQVTLSLSLTGHSLNLSLSNLAAPNVSIIISGLSNPTVAASSVWSLGVYSGGGIPMATGSSLSQFSAICGSVCRECANASYCLSCYSNPAVNSLSFLDVSAHSCVAACSSTQFAQGSLCYPCSTPCLSCSLMASNCTSCSSSALLWNTTCLALCPNTTFNSSGACAPCSNNCHACTSPATCSSCASGFLLQSNGSCSSSCPLGEYNYSSTCTLCGANCTACSESGCFACVGGNYLVQAAVVVCLGECPQGTYLSANLSWCEPCQAPCLSCSLTSSNCTACSAASVLKFLQNN